LPEYDLQLLTELADIKVSALARAWQILLKGVSEVQGAPRPAQAAEMVLIRLAYAAELPPPAELIKQLRDTAGTSRAAQVLAPTSSGGSAPATKMMSGAGVVMAPAIAEQAIFQSETRMQPMPTSYKELVALFAANREGGLHAQLYSNVYPVRCEKGVLEFRVAANAPADLAARLRKCLGKWTGQRWMVSISASAGQPTLAEEDCAVEQKRRDRAKTNPLMQAVLKAFPDAKMTAFRQKVIAPVSAASDDDIATLDVDNAIDTTGFED
jgi:DNA polymerase-3 subunit gamma/tau